MDIKVQKAFRTTNKKDHKKIIILLSHNKTLNGQNKERTLKAAREKGQVTFKGRTTGLTLHFSV